MKKALQVASVASMIDQFNRGNINILKELGYEVHVAANFEFGSTCSQERVNQYNDELLQQDIRVYNLLFDRKIFNKSNIEVYKQLKKIIDENHYEIIHCHSPIGGVITRLAARKSRKNGTKVIYTAHGFHFFKGAPVLNWLIYFPVEYICSFFTDVLITINQEDYLLAQKFMRAKKNEYIPGIGVDLDKFKNVQVDKIAKREELGIPKDAVMLLSVGELSNRKNHQVVLRVLEKLKQNNIHYCIVGQGSLEAPLRDMVNYLGLSKHVHFLGFRNDVIEICKVADIFVFPSLQEGLPVALMEAMATGLPVICSNIRGNKDLVIHREGGYLVDVKNIDEFIEAINNMILNKKACIEFSKFNIDRVKRYGSDNVMNKMDLIYQVDDYL